MNCQQCHKEFCYFCQAKIVGYDHFHGNNTCPLFTYDGSEERAANQPLRRAPLPRQNANADLVIQRQAMANPNVIRERKRCPSCKFQQVKFDTNNRMLLEVLSY